MPSEKNALTRRDALKKIAAGGATAAVSVFWVDALVSAAGQHAEHYHSPAASGAAWTPKVLSPAQNDTVVALAEIIIPQTDTAGSTKARVNEFIDGVLADATPANRQQFLGGLAWLDAHTTEAHGAAFTKLPPDQQLAVVTALSTFSPDTPGSDFFKAIKSLTVTGYYTSEIGMKEEIGDDGMMFFAEFTGCTHPEHQS